MSGRLILEAGFESLSEFRFVLKKCASTQKV